MKKKIFIIAIISVVAFFIYHFELLQYVSLDYIKEQQSSFQSYYEQNQFQTIAIYAFIYILMTALSIPGATAITLLGGALFGPIKGTAIVSFSSTIGATLAFLISRILLQDWVHKKFKKAFVAIDSGMKKDGAFYLLSLRLIPLFPFFLINLVMGLTKVSTFKYFIVSQIGMLPGTFVYVNAGTQLAAIQSLKEVASVNVLLSFALLGVFPLIAKWILDYLKAKKVYKNFKRPNKFDYNMVSIGAGAAGLVTSYIGAVVKAKVALIEKNAMGGDCLNTGCVPSKALIRSAKMIHLQKRAQDFGIDEVKINYNFAKIMERVQQVIKKIEPHDSVERYTNLGVECISGKAKIISPWEIEVNGKTITTKNITIATGASPFVPPIDGIDKVSILTSENLWELRELPKKFVVLGAGPIGLEMAQSFARLGSEVYLVEMAPRVLMIEDEEVSSIIEDKLKSEGVHVLTNHKAIKFDNDGQNQVLTVEFEGRNKEIIFDKVLVAVGRKANTKGFGLEELGIELRENKTILTNEYLQTNYPNIFACGDVAGPYQLTHTAAHQAWYCAVNGLFGKFKKFKVDYSVIPWCTYTDPEVATVGLNENKAKELGIEYDLTNYGIDDLDRAIADSEDHGVVRVLTNKGSDKIIGATIVGNHASDLILELITAMKYNIGLNKILGTIHIYPTMGEANKYVAGEWKRKQVNPTVMKYLEKFHRWSRS